MKLPCLLGGRARVRGRRLYVAVAVLAAATSLGGFFAVSAGGADGLTVTVDPAATPSASGYVDLPHMTYAAASAAVLTGTDIVLPIAIDELRSVRLSHVTVAVDAAKQAVALRGRADLAGVGSGVDILVSAFWGDGGSTSPATALGVKAGGVDLSRLNPLWRSALGSTTFDTARVVVSNRAQTLGPSSLPDEVADFYATPITVAAGSVAFQGDLHPSGPVGSVLGYAGYSSTVAIEGTLAGSAALLSGDATDAEKAELSLGATLTRSPTAPAWIETRTTVIRLDVAQGSGPRVAITDDLTVRVADTENRFAGTVDIGPTGAVTARLELLDGPFQPPFGLDRLSLDNVALEATYDAGAFRAAIAGDATIAGRADPLHVRGELTDTTTSTSATIGVDAPDGGVPLTDLLTLAGDYLEVSPAELPGADTLALEKIELSVENLGDPTTLALTARTAVASLRADVLLSLHKTDAGMAPLLVLRLADSGCAPGPCVRVARLLGGAKLGALVGDLQLDELQLVATTLDEPVSLSAAEQAFFAGVYGTAPSTLELSPGIDVEAKLPLSQLGAAREALGFAAGDAAVLRGTLGPETTIADLGDAGATWGTLSLSAKLPQAGGGRLPGWLTIDESTLEVVSADGVVAAGIRVDGHVVLGGMDNEFTGTLSYSEDGGLAGVLDLSGTTFHGPFGLDRLALSEVELDLGYDAGVFTGALLGKATIAGRSTPLQLRAELVERDGSTTLRFAVDGAMTVGEVMALSGKYLGTPQPSLLGAEDLKLDEVAFERERRRPDEQSAEETVLTFSATATVRTLKATVLVSLRQQDGAAEAQPLLGLQLIDPGCRPGACIRLSELFAGTKLGGVVGDLQVPAVDLIVTSMRTLVHPTAGEASFLANVYDPLPTKLTFAEGIALEAKLPLSLLGDEVRAALGFANDATATLRGTLGAQLTLSRLNGASVTLDQVSLEAVLPAESGGSVLPDWLKLKSSRLKVASQNGAIGAGVELDAQVTLDGKTNEFKGTLAYDAGGNLQGKLLLLGAFRAPFDLDRLQLANVAFEVRYAGGDFTGALDAEARVEGFAEPLRLSATLARDASGEDVVFTIDGSATATELLKLGGAYVGVSPARLPAAEGLTLTGIGFELERHTVDGTAHRVLTYTASAVLRGLRADVLLSVREGQTKPLLALQIVDDGCRPGECVRLSQLFRGTRLGPLVGDLRVPALNVVATSLTTLSPLSTLEQRFFAGVHGAPPTALTFDAGIGLEARLPVSTLPAPLRRLLALDESRDVILHGTLGASVDLARLGSLELTGVELKAKLPMSGTPTLLPSWLSFPDGWTTLGIRHSIDTISATLHTRVGVQLGGATFDVDLAGAYATAGSSTNLALRAILPTWRHPFDVQWLAALDSTTLAIDATFDPARSPQVTAGLSSSIVLGGSRTFDVAATLATGDSRSATITATYNGTATLGDIAGQILPSELAGARTAFAKAGLAELTIGPVSATATVTSSRTSLSLAAETLLRLQTTSIPATVLVTTGTGGSRGNDAAGFTIGVKAKGPLRAQDLAAGAPSVPLSLSGAALLLSSRDAVVESRDLDRVEFDFYKTIYGCAATSTTADCKPFQVHFTHGLMLAGTTTLPKAVLDLTELIGLRIDGQVVFEGTIPFGTMRDLSLKAYLPSLRLDAADWLQAGQLAFTLDRTGLGLGGTISIELPSNESFIFDVSTKIGFEPAGFMLTGRAIAGGAAGWHPAGQRWLVVRDLALQIGASSAGPTGPALEVGFGGTIKVGSKDLAASALFAIAPPAGQLELQGISARSTAGVELSDLVALQAAVAGAAGVPLKTDKLPQLAFRNVAFSYSEVTDEDLCLEPGIRLNADLYVGAGAGPAAVDLPPGRCGAKVVDDPPRQATCTGTCYATVFAAVDQSSISASGNLGGFQLGPFSLDDASVGVDLSATKQALHVEGGTTLGSFANGTVRIDMLPTTYHAVGNLQLPGGTHAYLFADASTGAAAPKFSGRLVLRDDFAAAFSNAVGGAVGALKPVIAAYTSVYNLVTGTGSITAFSNLSSLLATAGVAVPSTVKTTLDTIGKLQKGIDDFSKATGGAVHPTLGLDTLLNGIDIRFGGVAGYVTPKFCAGAKVRGKCYGKTLGPYCTGIWVSGDCYAIPPVGLKLPGLCSALKVGSKDCSFAGVMQRFVLPEIVTAVNAATGLGLEAGTIGNALQKLTTTFNPKNASLPPVGLDCAEVAADLDSLAQLKGSVALRTRVELYGTPLDFGVGWTFAGGSDPKAAAWSLLKQLLNPTAVGRCQGVPDGLGAVLEGASLSGSLSQSWILEGGTVTFSGAFDATDGNRYPAVRIDWGDGRKETVPPGSARTFARSHAYGDDDAPNTPIRVYTVSAVVQDARGDTVVDDLTVRNTPPAITNLTVTPSPAGEGALVTAAGDFSDRWAKERHKVAVDWGDGEPATTQQLAAGVGSFALTHRYDDDRADPYVVTVVVTDDDRGRDDQTAKVRVTNVAPKIASIEPVEIVVDDDGSTAPYPGRVDEGSLVVYKVVFTDPGTLETHTATIDWDDGSPVATVPVPAGDRTVLVAHAYADDVSPGHPAGTYDIAATIADDDGGKDAATRTQKVVNVAPTIDLTAVMRNIRGGDATLTLSGVVYDPSPNDSFSIVVNWADGRHWPTFDVPAGSTDWDGSVRRVARSWTPAGTTVVVTDDDGGSTTVPVPAPARSITSKPNP